MGMLVVLVPVLSGRLLVGRRDGAPGQAAVRITIGANVPPTVATRRRAFQDCLMHRQDCSGPRRGAHGNRIKPLHWVSLNTLISYSSLPTVQPNLLFSGILIFISTLGLLGNLTSLPRAILLRQIFLSTPSATSVHINKKIFRIKNQISSGIC